MKWDVDVAATATPSGWRCEVKVRDGAETVSDHTVDVTQSDLNRFAPGSTVEDLVKRSFDFLLEREQPQSILRRFNLPDIERYFPEYPEVIRA